MIAIFVFIFSANPVGVTPPAAPIAAIDASVTIMPRQKVIRYSGFPGIICH
jgi:hypothetical protein